ncbi:hypothetical protein GF356_08710 [candidate division GN15 bacterium]|nr:hypothetical protein [candidate division GN15 bacterium]
MMKRLVVFTLMATLVTLVTACSSDEQTQDQSASATDQESGIQVEIQADENEGFTPARGETIQQTIEYQPTDINWSFERQPVTVAGMQFTPPTQYIQGEATSPRVATFLYPPVQPERDSAILKVFYFGPDQGGSIEENMERWINQMHYDDGRDPHSAAIQYELEADGMPAHVLSMFGTYKEQVGGPMSGETVFQDRYRLVGVIFEAPEGNVFFKLTGPNETARVMIEPFMMMIRSAKKAARG